MPCVNEAVALLEPLPDSSSMKAQRMQLALIKQGLTGAPLTQASTKGASARPARVKRVGLTTEQAQRLKGQSAAVAAAARQLFERGWFAFARRELQAGRNPGRNDWQRTLCDGLLKGGISRSDLILAYQEQLGMTPGSAKVRASKAVAILLIGDLVKEYSGQLRFHPNQA